MEVLVEAQGLGGDSRHTTTPAIQAAVEAETAASPMPKLTRHEEEENLFGILKHTVAKKARQEDGVVFQRLALPSHLSGNTFSVFVVVVVDILRSPTFKMVPKFMIVHVYFVNRSWTQVDQL